MRIGLKLPGSYAFTLTELAVVIGVLCVLFVLFVPVFDHPRSKAQRIHCVNNLKNIGLAFRIYATDHGNRFPMEAPASEKGNREFLAQAGSFKYFLGLSNELATPKLLICRADKRPSVDSWIGLGPSNISYFIGLNTRVTNAQMLLAGDRNITNGVAPNGGILDLVPSRPAGWTHEIHLHQGNVVLVDGSVHQLNDSRLRETLSNSGDSTNRILLPE